MKKTISLILAAFLTLLFTACTDNSPDKPDTTQSSETESTENLTVDKYSVVPLSLYSGTTYISEYDEAISKVISSVDIETLRLSDDDSKKYSALNKTIDELNELKLKNAKNDFDDLTEMAKEMIATEDIEFFGGLSFRSDYSVQRADNYILSVRYDWDNYTGGMHPNYATYGYNYNSLTGEELKLSDLVNDTLALKELVFDELESKYSPETFFDLETARAEYDIEQFAWTVNYQNITFYFSPYDISPFAAGLITATIYFDEHPELFNEKYTKAPESYAFELTKWNDIELDLDEDDDRTDVVSVNINENTEEGYAYEIRITLNGEEFLFGGFEIFSDVVYLVNNNESFYVYVEAYSYNDVNDIYVFELKKDSVKESGRMLNAGFERLYVYNEDGDRSAFVSIFNNPDSFILTSYSSVFASFNSYKTYCIGEDDGMPQSDESIYKVCEDDVIILTLKSDITVKILPDEKDEVIPSGSKIKLIRTDNETFVDAKLEDSRECRIYTEFNEDEYLYYIGSLPETEVFEELLYAG